MWVFSTIIAVVGRALVPSATATGSTVSMFTRYMSDHSFGSRYTGKKIASSSLVPVQMISSIYLKYLPAHKTGKASIIFLYWVAWCLFLVMVSLESQSSFIFTSNEYFWLTWFQNRYSNCYGQCPWGLLGPVHLFRNSSSGSDHCWCWC